MTEPQNAVFPLYQEELLIIAGKLCRDNIRSLLKQW
jgi:hypothetical protein